MADAFIGDPVPLRDRDYQAAARTLGCSVAAVRAVALVESDGAGFLRDGRPKLLFERHVFHASTGGKYGALNPQVSSLQPGGYLGGAREYDRLREAIALDRTAALAAASWGKFQIMGFNHRLAGHATLDSFVAAMVSGEPAQLAAFVAFIQACKLDDAMIRHDWVDFARRYNGSAYARNAYDRKLAAAYARFNAPAPPQGSRPLLKQGDAGAAVRELQSLLGQPPDGQFGAATRSAVMAFQQGRKLGVDGVVGAGTWRALLG